ncbi:MAG: DinB family protein [Ktedonobacterales bacterium]
MSAQESALHLDTLAAIPDQLEAAVREAGAGAPSAAGAEWTPSEIAGHLGDAARYLGARMRRVVREQEPALPLFDENTMVELAAYRYRDLDELLAVFRLTSAGNVAFLRALPADAWERAGHHEVRGPLTLREIVAIESAHEQAHARQFREALGLGG